MKPKLQPNAGWGRIAPEPPADGKRLTEVPRIGLVLSSGGARGLAHIGVLQVLEENNVPICALAGCSMGAYVGGLWAAGLSIETLGRRAAEIKDRQALKSLLDFAFPPAKGLVYGEKLRQHLERDLNGVTFDALRLPTMIVATDLESLQAHVFKTGNVARAIHASAAIPGVCVPVEWEGHRYTDGGACEPLPVSLMKEHFEVDHIIAVNVMPLAEEAFTRRDDPTLQRPGWLRCAGSFTP
ncbi:MAG: patatin-like phospholipase family protein [Verrucomicrobiales bacterium]|nr:patatin-like phospholipase family protein [Verrucomicrobiales bacterium]